MVSFSDATRSRFPHCVALPSQVRAEVHAALRELGCRRGRDWVCEEAGAGAATPDHYHCKRRGLAHALWLWAIYQLPPTLPALADPSQRYGCFISLDQAVQAVLRRQHASRNTLVDQP